MIAKNNNDEHVKLTYLQLKMLTEVIDDKIDEVLAMKRYRESTNGYILEEEDVPFWEELENVIRKMPLHRPEQ